MTFPLREAYLNILIQGLDIFVWYEAQKVMKKLN